MEGEEVIGFVIILALIAAGVIVLVVAMVNRRKLLEMRHRERIAMIERGLVPPPEADPNGFERRVLGMRPPSRSSVRFRSAGVLMIGLGLGLLLLISYAGEAPGPGIGVGGALALVGLALLLNAMFSARDEDFPSAGANTRPEQTPAEGPTNNAAP